MGDAGDRDNEVAAMCGRYGADQLLFVGPEDLERLKERVAPRRVFAPNTPEGQTLLAGLGIDDSETSTRLVERPMTREELGDTAGLLLHAGTLPWHDLEDVIDPDYGEHFASGTPVPWGAVASEELPPAWYVLEGDPELSPEALAPLEPETIDEASLQSLERGCLLCSARGYDAAADAIASRDRAVHLCIVDEEDPPRSPSTRAAVDFVFASSAHEVAKALKEPEWREALG
jgi:hypothetical protein